MAKASPASLIHSKDRFHAALHGWYDAHRRKLPWRETPSLYKTVVSELMLQQTQVATVLPYFYRWLKELPAVATETPEGSTIRPSVPVEP